MPSKILITGGTGLVGSALQADLKNHGHSINVLTTRATVAEQEGFYYWNLKDEYIDVRAFEGVDYVIHLAGSNVADGRWTKKRKRLIRDSRIRSTALLVERAKNHKFKGVIAASGVGLYGADTGDQWLNENNERGHDFLAEVVSDWERELSGFEPLCEHLMILRIGVVLSENGGALKKLLGTFRCGLGSPIGTGRQWMSWIHISDLVSLISYGMENGTSGTFNAVAPNPVTNTEFSRKLAAALDKRIWLPNVPSFVLSMIFGEMSNIILGGNRASSEKLTKEGFEFRFEQIDDAFKDLLK